MADLYDTQDFSKCFSDPKEIRQYPEALRGLPYCVWKLTRDKGDRITKVPFNPRNGLHASVTTPDTFARLETALEAMARSGYNGVGVRLTDRVGCIDIDDCVDGAGKLSGEAEAVLRMLPEVWAEFSPSGRGVHAFFLVPGDFGFDRDEFFINNRARGLEIYLPDLTRRFMTVTGKVFRKGELRVTAAGLQMFCETFMRRPAAKTSAPDVTPPEGGSGLSDEEVIRLCCNSRGGKTFERYYSGDWEKDSNPNWSHSEADLSVCRRLAFFTGGDPEQMDRLFRKSGLMREKWDSPRGESTYGELTLKKAISGCDGFYDPGKRAAADFEAADLEDGESGEGPESRDPAAELDRWLSREMSREDMLSETFLGLALWARGEDPVRYLRIKDLVRKPVGIRDFETQLKKREKDAQQKALRGTETLRLTGCDSGETVIPPGWIVDDNGIHQLRLVSGTLQEESISPKPVLISAKLVDMDDGSEKLELTYPRNGQYVRCTAPRSDFLDKHAIVKYANRGLCVHSGTAAQMTKYLAELEEANERTIPVRRCVSRAGWFGTEFYPYGMREAVQCQEDATGTTNLIEAMHTGGREEVWMALAREVRQYPFARCMLAVSFAAPLIRLLGHRNIFFHIWYDSRSGKTAVAKLALAVWGNPEKLLGTYNGTLYGLEQRCGTLKNLPVVLDERQSLQEKKMSVNDLVYNLGNGVGKTQGKPGSGIRPVGTWNTCILSTGEQPLTKENSMDGINTRLMELYACPLMDQNGTVNELLGRRLNTEAVSNYGFAGEKLIRFLREEIIGERRDMDQIADRMKEELRTVQEAMEQKLSPKARENPHLMNAAILALGDAFASRAVFGETEEQALQGAVSMGVRVLETLEADRQPITNTAAWDYICGWVAANMSHFHTVDKAGVMLNATMTPTFGVIESDYVYVISNLMSEALRDGGFDTTTCIRGFARAGYIVRIKEKDGTMRNTKKKSINGILNPTYVLRKVRMGGEPDGEFIVTDEPVPEQLRMPIAK